MEENFYEELKKIMLQSEPDSIFFDKDEGLWYVTTEWLVGTFAGRAFIDEKSNSIENCLEQMHNYFLEHINHNSIVGHLVTKSGYPNLDKVKFYLKIKKYEEDC